MKLIDQLIEQIQPGLEALREDITINPNYHVMKSLAAKIVDEAGGDYEHAVRVVMTMKIQVADMEDAEKAANYLFQAYQLVRTMVIDLCSVPDEKAILCACADISINC